MPRSGGNVQALIAMTVSGAGLSNFPSCDPFNLLPYPMTEQNMNINRRRIGVTTACKSGSDRQGKEGPPCRFLVLTGGTGGRADESLGRLARAVFRR